MFDSSFKYLFRNSINSFYSSVNGSKDFSRISSTNFSGYIKSPHALNFQRTTKNFYWYSYNNSSRKSFKGSPGNSSKNFSKMIKRSLQEFFHWFNKEFKNSAEDSLKNHTNIFSLQEKFFYRFQLIPYNFFFKDFFRD